MKPATNTLNEVFQASIRLVVPLYQRPYVWERERHWEPLWEDIAVVLDRHLDGEPVRHFLGAIVLDQEDTQLGEIPRRLVIDGQQRLTTLQVLLAAAVSNARRDGADQQARLLSKLVENDPDLASGDDRFKVWPTNADQAAFREVMTHGSDRASAPSGAIYEAYAYFAGAIRGWLDTESPSPQERARRHKGLWVTLTSLLQMVSINLEADDNAQVIFETLNARGTPLLAMDLVKNACFYGAQREGADVDALNEQVWEPELGAKYWRARVRQGRLIRPRAELFLMHWLAMKMSRIVAATELFAEFRAHFLQPPSSRATEELLRELCADAAVLRGFDDRPAGSVEERFFRHLDALDTSTVFPVALLLYRSPAVSEARRETSLRMLESWLVRRMLCGLTAQAYNRLMAELLKDVARDLEHADEVIAGFLRSSDASSALWPTDGVLISSLATRGLYGWISQKRIVMILAAIELSLRRSNKVEDLYKLPTNLTVEHVIPQKWGDHWPVADAVSADERDARIHRLGNLTLTSGPLNSSLSNASWAVKRPALVKHSLLALNQRIATELDWDDASIDRHGEDLTRQILALWPGPSDPEWPATAKRVPSVMDAASPAALGSSPAAVGSPTSGRVASGGRARSRRTDWGWELYASELNVPAGRLAIGRALVGAVESAVRARSLDWNPVYRQGYVAFQRGGGYNVVLVDILWNRVPRVAVLLHKAPAELGCTDPYPELATHWDRTQRQWGWTVPTLDAVPDVGLVIDLVRPFHPARGPMTSP